MFTMDILKKIKRNVDARVEDFGHQFFIFGIFGFLNYPIYWMVWKFFAIQSYENLGLRITATLLCIPLIFWKHWPLSLKNWLPLYWYVTLTFCLPFFFTFMMLENDANSIWLMSLTAIMFWLILLVDLLSFLVILLVGSISAVLVYLFLYHNLPVADYGGIISQCIGTLLVGVIFANIKANVEQEKLQIMKALGATVAHELRTPLTTIQFSVAGTQNYLPILVDAYQTAKAHHLNVQPIQAEHLQILSGVFDGIQAELAYSDTIIDMILVNAKEGVSKAEFKACSMRSCIEEALTRYPFKGEQKKLITWDEKDFVFFGDQMLFIHLLFNLMKNALYYIDAAGKGTIQIWAEIHEKENMLYFKDTAQGIPPAVLSKLFEKFYTTTRHGTGLGLAYCKMVMTSFDGAISCTSKYGEYTQFKMTFPTYEQAQA